MQKLLFCLICIYTASVQADCVRDTISEMLVKQGTPQAQLEGMEPQNFQEMFDTLNAQSPKVSLALWMAHDACVAKGVKDSFYAEKSQSICPKSKSQFKTICLKEFLKDYKPKTITGLTYLNVVVVAAAGLDKIKFQNRDQIELHLVNSMIEVALGYSENNHLFHNKKTKGIVNWLQMFVYKFVEEQLHKKYLENAIPQIEEQLVKIEKSVAKRSMASQQDSKIKSTLVNLKNKLATLKQKRPLNL